MGWLKALTNLSLNSRSHNADQLGGAGGFHPTLVCQSGHQRFRARVLFSAESRSPRPALVLGPLGGRGPAWACAGRNRIRTKLHYINNRNFSKESGRVGAERLPGGTAAARAAEPPGIFAALLPRRGLVRAALGAVAVLNGGHDPVGEDGQPPSHGPHALLELRHVGGTGQHAGQVVAPCRPLPLLLEQVRRADG